MMGKGKDICVLTCLSAVVVIGQLVWAAGIPVRHWDLQAVDQYGEGTHPAIKGEYKVSVEGVILNQSEYMLNPAMSGSGAWQIYIQGDPNDHAGTAVWMGQRYDNIPGGSGAYGGQEWAAELFRIEHDPAGAYQLRPGDKVRVTGLCKFYKGKTNINERHNVKPENDFVIELVEPAVGLPLPEVITLDMVKDINNNYIFDPNRGCEPSGTRIPDTAPGPEYYQGRLVRVNGVRFVSVDWRPGDGETINAVIEDTGGKTFPVIFGRGPGFSCSYKNNLPEVFDIIGIFDQESSNFYPCMDGYRLWVTNYDGNGAVLTDFGLGKNHLAGDIDLDGDVDVADFSRLAENWMLRRTN